MRPLAVVGNVNVDLILGPAEPWPVAGTEVIVDHDELRVGGSAGNTALAWMALGVDFQIAASVGNDQFGPWLRNAFAGNAGNWPVEPSSTTLSVGITHPNGERTFFTTRGHLPLLSFAQVQTMLDTRRLRGGYALLCGTFLTDSLRDDYDSFFDWADANGIDVALDTGWPRDGWSEQNRIAAAGWLKRSRCSLLNEVESTAVAGCSDAIEAAHRLKAMMPPRAIVVVKRGPEDVIGIDADGTLMSVKTPQVKVVDTIGAGDVFNAAFLAALCAGNSLQTCLSAGARVASQTISTSPRRYGEPDTLSKLETLS